MALAFLANCAGGGLNGFASEGGVPALPLAAGGGPSNPVARGFAGVPLCLPLPLSLVEDERSPQRPL
jgi:hypothetical protein